jgi:hypothetical protein
MAEKKQFFRNIQPGDVSIEGRQSNGITAKSDGSVILYSGVKENELENLQNYNGNIPIDGYLGNIIAVLKADQNVDFPTGNNNDETYIETKQIDVNKIITPKNQTSPDALYDPCLDLTTLSEEKRTKFVLDVVDYVISDKGAKKKYTDIIPLDGGTVGRSHFAVDGFDSLYTAMGDAVIQKYFGNDKNGQPMTVKKMIQYYAISCRDAYPGDKSTEVKNDGEGCRYEYPKGTYDPKKDACKRNWGCYTGGYNPLGIDWKGGMTKFVNDPANNIIQDKAVVVSRIDAVERSIKKGWKTAFEWAVAIGMDNSGGFDTIASAAGWDAIKAIDGYVEFKKGKRGYDHRVERRALIYKYFPPCGGGVPIGVGPKKEEATLVGNELLPTYTPVSNSSNEKLQNIVEVIETANNVPPPAIEYLPDTEFQAQGPAQILDTGSTYITVGNLEILTPEKYAEGAKITVTGNKGYKINYTKKGKFFYPDTSKIPILKDNAFIQKVKQIASEFNINAEFLIKIMINESGLNPAAGLWRKCLNANCSGKVLYSNKPEAGYTLFGCGLVGFIRPYAPKICNGNSVDVVITQSALTQLDYVRNILKNQEKTVKGADDATLYMHFFIPALVPAVKSGNDSTSLSYKGVTAETVSFQNPSIATTIGKNAGDPLTVGDFRQFVNIKFNYTIPPL